MVVASRDRKRWGKIRKFFDYHYPCYLWSLRFFFFLRKMKIEKKERIKARIDAVRRRFNLFEMAVLRKIEIYVSSSVLGFVPLRLRIVNFQTPI